MIFSTTPTETQTNPLDTQIGGGHYKDFPIQPIEFCMVNKLDHCQSNVVKYVSRFRTKGGLEDLLKAKHYIEILIEFEYGRNNTYGRDVTPEFEEYERT